MVGEPGIEEVDDASIVCPARHGGVDEERLDLRREPQAAIVDHVVQRFDAEAVTGAEELLPLSIPDGERKHTVETVQASEPRLGEGGEQYLRVTGRVELVAERRELDGQLLEVEISPL